MFPFRYQTIFRSRWMALLWAAGICWMAYDFAAPDGDAAGNNQQMASDMPLNAADVAAIQAQLNQL
ncbi:MAG: hypothetical protein QOH81_3382 [Sphingomonadales bacterium]|jgi:hypothetical protein|nr:hypothetical protein [Sphingomonadales bacterium]